MRAGSPYQGTSMITKLIQRLGARPLWAGEHQMDEAADEREPPRRQRARGLVVD